MKEYLIAYCTQNDRILTMSVVAKSQKEAIKIFYLDNCLDAIIAITLIER